MVSAAGEGELACGLRGGGWLDAIVPGSQSPPSLLSGAMRGGGAAGLKQRFPGSKLKGGMMFVVRYDDSMNRITFDPEQCGGRPCIRGMRIRVVDVLDLLANGLTPREVIDELPDLEPEDIQACLRYASRKINHPVLTPA